jgi:hypothetical protein
MRAILGGLVLGATLLAATALAEPAPVLSPQVDAAGKPLPFGRPPHRPDDTPLGSGPYKAVMATDPGLPVHVFYAPKNLDAAGKLPIISWGNGACINAGNRFRFFLTEIASHGFLVISAGEMGPVSLEVGPQENPKVPAPGAAPPPPPALDPKAPPVVRNTDADLKAAIDWAVAENGRPGSRFYHRLDTGKIAVAGQSCGTILALDNAGDPRVSTVALFSGGVRLNPNGFGPAPAPGAPSGKAVLDAVHTPILFLSGDAQHDIAFGPGGDDFAYLTKVPAFHAWKDQLTHIGTYGLPDGGELGRIADAWFLWQLKGDARAAAMFKGPDCALCKDPTWHAEKKNID